jgi:hypothetical protein
MPHLIAQIGQRRTGLSYTRAYTFGISLEERLSILQEG